MDLTTGKAQEVITWSSLQPQLGIAAELYQEEGKRLIGDWLAQQLQRIDDPEFAALFSDHLRFEGVVDHDFNHRLVRFNSQTLLGGIRFFGLDPNLPFVEVIAHNFSDFKQLRDCVAKEWRNFNPIALRILVGAGERPVSDAHLDTTIFGATYGAMAASTIEAQSHVSLVPFDNLDLANKMIEERFNHIGVKQPDLAKRLHRSTPEDVQTWHAASQLRVICVRADGVNKEVGLFAAMPDTVDWLVGDVVQEEVVAVEFNGHGYAAMAQSAWAAQPDVDPSRLLLGTIDAANIASRRSAVRAARRPLLDYLFVPLISHLAPSSV